MSKQKKDFTQNILTGAQKFISEANKEKAAKESSKEVYRINLALDPDLKPFINKFWHTNELDSRNEAVNYIIRAFKEAWEAQAKE